MTINSLEHHPEALYLITGQFELLFVIALIAGLSSFFGAYLRRRGENQAIKENFDLIREQLRITTSDTEAIKQHLTSQAWLSQQQWSARELYYSNVLTHLFNYCLAIDGIAEYYVEPGSEYKNDSQQGEHFHQLMDSSKVSFEQVLALQGPSALYLSQKTIDSLNELVVKHYSLITYDVSSTAEYVIHAQKLGQSTYDLVLNEAKIHLGITP